MVLTLQDVHPDQFRALRSSPDLPLEIVLSLERERKKIDTITHLTTFHLPMTA